MEIMGGCLTIPRGDNPSTGRATTRQLIGCRVTSIGRLKVCAEKSRPHAYRSPSTIKLVSKGRLSLTPRGRETQPLPTKWELFSLGTSHRNKVPVRLTPWWKAGKEMPLEGGVALKVHRKCTVRINSREANRL